MVISDTVIEAVRKAFEGRFRADARILEPVKGSYEEGNHAAIAVYLDLNEATKADENPVHRGGAPVFNFSISHLYGSWKRDLLHRFYDDHALDGFSVSLDSLTIINEHSRAWLSRFYRLDGTLDGRPVITVSLQTSNRADISDDLDVICYRAFGSLGTYTCIADSATHHAVVTAFIDDSTGSKPASDFIDAAHAHSYEVIRYGLTQSAEGPMTFTAEIALDADRYLQFEAF